MGGCQTKLTTAATSGQFDTLPDIMLMQDNAFQKNVISYPDAFVDLTGSAIDYTQFPQGKAGFSTVDGKNYGVPFDNGAVIACYRTDILEQAGYTIDDFTDITFSDYLEKGKLFWEKIGKPLLSCIAGESDVIVMMLQSAGGSFFDESGKANIVNNDILKEVMETYRQMVEAGVLVEVNDWDQYIATINNGTVASGCKRMLDYGFCTRSTRSRLVNGISPICQDLTVLQLQQTMQTRVVLAGQ